MSKKELEARVVALEARVCELEARPPSYYPYYPYHSVIPPGGNWWPSPLLPLTTCVASSAPPEAMEL